MPPRSPTCSRAWDVSGPATLSRAFRSTTMEYLASWARRTGDFVVQLYYAEYLWSWMVRTGDFLVQL